MLTPTELIAAHLKIEKAQIKRVEKWAKVWLVVVSGKGARFVSFSVTNMEVDRIISEERLNNGLLLTKSITDGKFVKLYSNFHTGGDFALRACNGKVTIYIDGEADCFWSIKGGSKYIRSYDSKRAKNVEGILNRCQKDGLF